MVTLKQVAAAAGVHLSSAATVLNAARGNTCVGEATRKRVVAAARRLGYVRNESARRLRTGKSNAVGFIGGDLSNPFFSELAAALERELDLHGLQLVLSHVSPVQAHSFTQTVETFRQQMLSKIIYWDESASCRMLSMQAKEQLIPIGFTIRPRLGVWLDLGYAIQLTVAYLIEKRQRRVCFYAPDRQVQSPSVTIRQKSFVDECRRQDLPAPVCASYAGESWNIEAAVAGARDLLKRMPAIETFVGFNDVAALGILLAADDLRPRPKVVCFDGTPLVRCWPGSPPYFDLKISKLAEMAASVCVGTQSLALTGRKDHWLRPELIA